MKAALMGQLFLFMKVAQKSDKSWIVDLLTEVYRDNPTVLYAANYKAKNIQKVFEFSFDEFFSINGVFYHPNKKAVLFINPGVANRNSSLFKQLKFMLSVSGIRNGLKLKRRRKIMLNERSKEPFIHIGVFGISNHAERFKTALDIKNFVFNMAREKKLDVYLETPLEKTRKVYEYYGFECFSEYYLEEAKHPWYFMRLKFQDIPDVR
jgi:hypothetical protein